MTTPDTTTKARTAVNALLEGHSPNGVTPDDLGKFGEVYGEMLRAWEQGKTEAAWRVYVTYADNSPEIAALRAGDPEPPKPIWSTGELLRAEFPDPKWAVPGLLPVGLSVLAGRPKLGKSWLSLQIAVAVGTGGLVLNQQVEAGRALYLALEDSPRRLKERLYKQTAPATADADFRFEWPFLHERGTADLLHEIDRKGYSLVVIDTLARAVGGADQMDLGAMNLLYGSLQRIAQDRQVTILLVDHHRKGASKGEGDPIDDIMGSTGKAAVADAALGLYRKQGNRNAILKIVGRDVDEQELAVNFDQMTGCWQLVGNAGEVIQGEQMEEILTALKTLGKATHREVMDATGQDRGNSFRRLEKLIQRGKVLRIEGNPIRFQTVGDD